MSYAAPGTSGAKIAYKAHYDNFIGGKWVAPVKGEYFDVITPINGKPYTKAARSGAEICAIDRDQHSGHELAGPITAGGQHTVRPNRRHAELRFGDSG